MVFSDLLKLMIHKKASDLFITAGVPPSIKIDGKVIHQVGMPWHWGYEGLSTGDVVNELTSLIADPNVSMHEGKAFVCNVEKA
jgi:Tfp pilus assembly ATPase PilU